MRSIAIVCLLSFSALYAMDLVSLLEKNADQESEIYLTKTFPSIPLSKVAEHYENLSLACRGKVITQMPDNVLTVHRIAMWLPQELQKHIITYMFGGYKAMMQLKEGEDPTEQENQKIESMQNYNKKVDAAVEKFCNKRIGKEIQLFYDLKNAVAEDQSIVPIYVMSKKDRIDFLSKLNVWYAPIMDPFMNEEERQLVDALSEDERVYFNDKSINKCPRLEDHVFICCMSCVGAVFLASTLTCSYGVSIFCCGMSSKSMPLCIGGTCVGGFCGGCTTGICCLYRSEIKKEVL